ncbi:hypothetical protein BV20DRAFT_956031 [Pilatotrama ljubarskyi]|nr:hypothetical protein BV20DRAFT_956031 [Pilatotrama ljubarskyi]
MLVSRVFRGVPSGGLRGRVAGLRRCQSILSSTGATAKEFKVVLEDNDTLYIDQELAEALGWTPQVAHSDSGTPGTVSLTLSGWAPHYFAIARTGSDSDRLARATVESSCNPRVQAMLEYLKDR